MIINGRRFTPPSSTGRRTPDQSSAAPSPTSSGSPRHVRIMALNPTDNTPASSKSYADAVFEPPPTNGDIDETAVKESPPHGHERSNSGPRPLGEVFDEGEGRVDPSPRLPSSSPSLRHPRGRLEQSDSRETYAEAVKEGLSGGDSGAKSEDSSTATTFHGAGLDEAPRSPVRRTHRRTQSKNSLGASSGSVLDAIPDSPPQYTGLDGSTTEQKGQLEPSPVIYENVYNKSGENLASLAPVDGYYTSLRQRANKQATTEPPAAVDGRERRDGELVSGRRAGAGWSRSAIRWAPLNVPLQRRLQTLLVLMHTISIAGLLAVFFMLCTIPLLWPILVPYLLYVLLSRASIDGKLSQRSEWLRHSKIWSLFGSYFPARLHRSEPLEPTRKYIFGYHPHGIISHGAFAAFATEALGFSQLFPGITNTLLTLDANFRVPLYRDYVLRMGLASVSRESCENILSRGGPNGEGMGRAITIVIGGARESLDATPHTLRLVLKRRKGFVKLAIRTGADLVPVLAFGENDLYEQLDTNAHPYIHKAQMLVKKVLGFTVPLFHARGVFNYDVGLMPYRRPINVVVGRAIRIQQASQPDPAYVEAIHKQYTQELLRLWDDWKDTFARYRKGELELVE